MWRTVDGDGSCSPLESGLKIDHNLVFFEVGFSLVDELVGRAEAAPPAKSRGIGDGRSSGEGSTQAEEK